MTNAGFTGTREGMNDKQAAELERLMRKHRVTRLTIGGCTGADVAAYHIAKKLKCKIWCRPASDVQEKWKAKGLKYDKVFPAEPALVRNEKIVTDGEILFACPRLPTEEQRSGTWATVRYAKCIDHTFVLLWPNGSHQLVDKARIERERATRDARRQAPWQPPESSPTLRLKSRPAAVTSAKRRATGTAAKTISNSGSNTLPSRPRLRKKA